MDEKNKKNKWKSKKILGCILTVIIMVAAAAGIYFYMNRFDPVRYVQAVLDVSYKEKTEEYSKMTGTSRKEAEAVFEKNLDVTMEKFHSSAIQRNWKRSTGYFLHKSSGRLIIRSEKVKSRKTEVI